MEVTLTILLSFTRRAVALCVGVSFILLPSAFPQGPLTPPAAPGPTMKTLDQVDTHIGQAGEKRVDVNPLPGSPSAYSVISASGSYYLSANIYLFIGSGIYIDADNVTVDLNGFTIFSFNSGGSGNGITIEPNRTNITIRNGHIVGTTTYSAGTFTPGGFNDGIHADFTNSNIVIDHVTVSGLAGAGIQAPGPSVIIHDCTISTTAGTGIYSPASGSVRDCQADTCGGYGLDVKTASNCSGSSSGSGKGLQAYTASNCTGSSSGSGTGLQAATANNCVGTSGSGTGLFAAHIAIGCYGFSDSGTGLSAYIANSCQGTTSSGTAQSITYKYNMP